MKIIHNNLPQIMYPVGDNIITNIPIIIGLSKKIKSFLRTKVDKNIAIINLICSGSSGAIIASIIATTLTKKYVVSIYHIKKENENSHGYVYYDKDFNGINIIVDDLIASGATMKYIFSQIKNNVKIDLIAVTGNVYSEAKKILLNKNPSYLLCRK